jgi:hypothetical protein
LLKINLGELLPRGVSWQVFFTWHCGRAIGVPKSTLRTLDRDKIE